MQSETTYINLTGIWRYRLKSLGYPWKVSEKNWIIIQDAANLMNVEGKIDNCDDLFSYDARNPTITYIFETKQDQDSANDKFSIKF